MLRVDSGEVPGGGSIIGGGPSSLVRGQPAGEEEVHCFPKRRAHRFPNRRTHRCSNRSTAGAALGRKRSMAGAAAHEHAFVSGAASLHGHAVGGHLVLGDATVVRGHRLGVEGRSAAVHLLRLLRWSSHLLRLTCELSLLLPLCSCHLQTPVQLNPGATQPLVPILLQRSSCCRTVGSGCLARVFFRAHLCRIFSAAPFANSINCNSHYVGGLLLA
jgi:hypothetical protein